MASTPPIWASLPYAQLQLNYLAPAIAYHRYKPGIRVPEHMARGAFTLALGLSSVLGMVLYEKGYGKIAFTFGIAAATVGAFIAAAEVMSFYSVPEPPISVDPLDELAPYLQNANKG